MDRNLSILIPDGESNLTIKILRSLLDLKGIRVYLMSTTRRLGIRNSRTVREFIWDPEFMTDRVWVGRINSLMESRSIDVLMPVHAVAIRRLIKNRDQLLYPDRTLIPYTLADFDIALDKRLLADHMEKVGTPYPVSWPLFKTDGTLNDLKSFKYPLLLKPTLGMGGGIGIMRFETAAELEHYLHTDLPEEPVMLQEFVEGIDMGFNVLCRDGEILAYSIQIGTLFGKAKYTPQIGLKMIEEEIVYQSMCRMLQSLDWTGVAHIDLIYNPCTGSFKVVELNPRYWLTMHASTMAGVNFPLYYCLAVKGKEFTRPKYRKAEFFELKGLCKWVWLKPLRLFRFAYIWNHTPVESWFRDPLVYLTSMVYKLVSFRKPSTAPRPSRNSDNTGN